MSELATGCSDCGGQHRRCVSTAEKTNIAVGIADFKGIIMEFVAVGISLRNYALPSVQGAEFHPGFDRPRRSEIERGAVRSCDVARCAIKSYRIPVLS